jgi:HD-like signal output (HDOD) protein
MTSAARYHQADDVPTLDEVVNEIAELRPLGAIATQILAITEGDRFSAHELAKVISSDQALSAKMLRLSNSAYYGFPRRITTVRDAIVLLGFRAVRSATLASCVIDAIPGEVHNIEQQPFWRYSVSVGMLAEIIARAERMPHDEAFTAGVVHNIGRLALDQHYPQLLRRSIEHARAQGMSVHDAERALLGFSDAELGGGLALHWNFPEPLTEAVRRHSTSVYALEDAGALVAYVARARMFANSLGLSDGVERAVQTSPPAEWTQPPLSVTLEREGGVDGVMERVGAFLDTTVG